MKTFKALSMFTGAVSVIGYLLCSFAAASFDLREWPDEMREVAAIIAACVLILGAPVVSQLRDESEKK